MIVHRAYRDHEDYLPTSPNLTPTQKRIAEKWCDEEKYKNMARTDKGIFEALVNLASFLFIHFNKEIFVLVDDSIYSDGVLRIKNRVNAKNEIVAAEVEIEDVVALCIGSLRCLLKPSSSVNKYMYRSVLTGISYLMAAGLSKLANVSTYKFQDKHVFSPFYGLTVTELESLLSKLNLKCKSTIMNHYNGYKNEILSIWSVMNYLNSGCKKTKNYWKNSGTVSGLSTAFGILKIRSIILKLLSDISNSVEIYIFEKMETPQFK